MVSLTAAATAAAADPSIPDTKILAPGEIDGQATLGFSRFGAGQGTAIDALPSLRAGLPGPFDVAFTVPYRHDLETSQEALRSGLRTEVGFRFLDGERQTAVLRGYVMLDPTSADQGVGTGSHNFGVNSTLRVEDWGPGTLYLRGALERHDRRDAGAMKRYRLDNRLTLEAGIGLAVDIQAEPYLGVRGTQGIEGSGSNNQQSLSFRPGIRFALTPNTDLEILGHLDTLQRDVEPERAIFATWTYQHRPPARETEDLQERLQTAETRIERLNRRMSALEGRSSEPSGNTQDRSSTGLVVLNHSGIPELTTLVVDTLEGELDLEVHEAREEEDVPRRDRTIVQYRPGHAERARSIARALPGNQVIERQEELPEQAEVAVLIGFDLE